ncbi:unnamed protein product [Rhizophagus irregularis]|nr:unnamed protein product [Rhizophagus irregularis]
MLCKHLVNLKGPVDFSLFKILRRNNQLPFLILDKTCDIEGNDHTHTDNEGNDHAHTDNEGNDRTHTVSGGNDIHTNDQETNNTNESDIFENLIDITQQTLNLLEEQKRSRNILWAQGVKRNFNQIKTMVDEIHKYKRRNTMPPLITKRNAISFFFQILEHFLNELSGFY